MTSLAYGICLRSSRDDGGSQVGFVVLATATTGICSITSLPMWPSALVTGRSRQHSIHRPDRAGWPRGAKIPIGNDLARLRTTGPITAHLAIPPSMQSKALNPVYSGLAAMWRPSIDEMQRKEEREQCPYPPNQTTRTASIAVWICSQ